MVKVLRFRTAWGVDPTPGFENYKAWLPELKQKGYAGIEVNFWDIEDLAGLRQVCDDAGMDIIAMVMSGWPHAQGARPRGLDADYHLSFYRQQLERAKILRPYKINAHSGSDIWSVDEAIKFYKGTLEIDAELGLTGKVSHETHRNRGLASPYNTIQILRSVPSLIITGDFSHWVVSCERLLDLAEEDNELLDEVFPHVNHIHSRVGTTQSSQCPDPEDPVYAPERASFENMWKRAIAARAKVVGPDHVVTFVPEWGPYPYHPHGSVRDFGEVADTEGARQHKIFESV